MSERVAELNASGGARRREWSARSDNATPPTVEDALALGLTRAEYELVCEHQDARPTRWSWRCTR